MLSPKSWRGGGQVFHHFGWISTKKMTKAVRVLSKIKVQSQIPNSAFLGREGWSATSRAYRDHHRAPRMIFLPSHDCSPRLGNESLRAVGLGKERESTQSKQCTELLPAMQGSTAQEQHVFYRGFSHGVHNPVKFYLSSALGRCAIPIRPVLLCWH